MLKRQKQYGPTINGRETSTRERIRSARRGRPQTSPKTAAPASADGEKTSDENERS